MVTSDWKQIVPLKFQSTRPTQKVSIGNNGEENNSQDKNALDNNTDQICGRHKTDQATHEDTGLEQEYFIDYEYEEDELVPEVVPPLPK